MKQFQYSMNTFCIVVFTNMMVLLKHRHISKIANRNTHEVHFEKISEMCYLHWDFCRNLYITHSASAWLSWFPKFQFIYKKQNVTLKVSLFITEVVQNIQNKGFSSVLSLMFCMNMEQSMKKLPWASYETQMP